MDHATTESTGERPTTPRPVGYAVLAATLGVGATLAVVLGTGALPVLSLAVGTAVVGLVAWRLRVDLAVAGTLFVLGVGFGLLAVTPTAPGYTQWTPLILVGVGGLYGLFVVAKVAVKAVVRLIGQRYARGELAAELWDVGASVVSLLYLVWHALSFAERAVRSLVVALVGPSMVVLNTYLTLAAQVSEAVVDISVLLFTVAVVLGFHTLSTWTRAATLVQRWGRPTRDAERPTEARS